MIYLDFGGKWLDRFRPRIERLPDKSFEEATVAEKIDQILMTAGVLSAIIAPIWL